MGETSNETRKQFGNRYLTEDDNVFKHNAWDDVKWDEEQEKLALESVQKNSAIVMPTEQVSKYINEADTNWNAFYNLHQNKFFKDRHWLFTEFPELKTSHSTSESFNIFEIGCGVGNTILPILKYNNDDNVQIYGCDFSPRAIEILQKNENFDSKRCQVFVLDATNENWQDSLPFGENSIDIIVMIFVLSAIKPERMQTVLENCFKYLKPGTGQVLFRDYGRYDLAQLRFKAGKCLQNNFYARGDGTLVYFFDQDEIRMRFLNAGFVEGQNIVDRRLQVNRGKQLKMYRVWIQAKYRKPNE
ncbi:tRNA N(3)-methylcytidine methyltransferase Mettl2 [Sitodiplosis mosellana]|uniref:tRNA N(3)-methylcytidine methyltransferase Mettl2 n=1 Tax=Sitodiplosis mosellana TaxID=263140 RepID=UPI0024442E76|nr:tRNA N(3)-methylcytidine methyltransferase Mettl2 [Sitodiplosis mosellana]